MEYLIMLWLVGWMFVCGMIYADEDIRSIKITIMFMTLSLLLWPMVLGYVVGCIIEDVKRAL